MRYLRKVQAVELEGMRKDAVDPEAFEVARSIVEDVRARGEDALWEYAARFGDVRNRDDLFLSRQDMERAYHGLCREQSALLERIASRIQTFAVAQKESLRDFEFAIPGGLAGQCISPVARAGCYAPGGRYPLPSSVLMTAVTARAAGVREVWVASPKPDHITRAAAYIAGADGFLAAGGAQAIAALAFGAGPLSACDTVVGPGNRYVTAAKKIVSGSVGIDMLAGPSELVVVADGSTDASLVAADLIAQAEHDPDASPVLVTIDASLLDRVEQECARQLADLPTGKQAMEGLKNGFAVVVSDLDEAAGICDLIAPEHLELMVEGAEAKASKFKNYGALFIGEGAAEVLGDYGAGPNHTLPTGGTARFTGGLSVHSFLRVRTWMRLDDRSRAGELINDSIRMAEIEGLKGHARSARLRLSKGRSVVPEK